MLVNSKEADKILEATDVVCMNCVKDTLNNEVACDDCPVRKLCLSLEYEKEKLKYTKENVLNYLSEVEHSYHYKYVEACTNIKYSVAAQEKARQYGDKESAIHSLISDFEKDFE